MSMTYDEQLQYYSDLLILQYRGQPKAQATIQTIARQALCDNIALAIQDAYNLSTAVGVQLDVLGKYANVDRNALVPLGGSPLNDDDFRTLVLLALATNTCKGSLKDIETILFTYFGNSIIVFDNINMTLSYFVNSSFASLAALRAFIALDLLPRPTGVGLSSIVYAVGLDHYFAFSSYYTLWDSTLRGFGSYYGADARLFTGTSTLGSKIITGIADTSVLTAGYPISGPALDTSTLIDTIDSPTQIHVTKNALVSSISGNLVSQAPRPWINYSNVVTP